MAPPKHQQPDYEQPEHKKIEHKQAKLDKAVRNEAGLHNANSNIAANNIAAKNTGFKNIELKDNGSSKIDMAAQNIQDNARAMMVKIDELKQRQKIIMQGKAAYQQRHKNRGKLTARERIERLIDNGSDFLELGLFAAWELFCEMSFPLFSFGRGQKN